MVSAHWKLVGNGEMIDVPKPLMLSAVPERRPSDETETDEFIIL